MAVAKQLHHDLMYSMATVREGYETEGRRKPTSATSYHATPLSAQFPHLYVPSKHLLSDCVVVFYRVCHVVFQLTCIDVFKHRGGLGSSARRGGRVVLLLGFFTSLLHLFARARLGGSSSMTVGVLLLSVLVTHDHVNGTAFKPRMRLWPGPSQTPDQGSALCVTSFLLLSALSTPHSTHSLLGFIVKDDFTFSYSTEASFRFAQGPHSGNSRAKVAPSPLSSPRPRIRHIIGRSVRFRPVNGQFADRLPVRERLGSWHSERGEKARNSGAPLFSRRRPTSVVYRQLSDHSPLQNTSSLHRPGASVRFKWGSEISFSAHIDHLLELRISVCKAELSRKLFFFVTSRKLAQF